MPVGISLKNRPVLVVGGGEVALRKVETLIDYSCNITVISPDIVDKLEWFSKNGNIALLKRQYMSPEASAYGFVIAASDDLRLNKLVSDDCRKSGVPINDVDNPDLCDIIFPAVLRRDLLTIAVSTDGQAPFLSGHLKMVLDGIFKSHWSKIAKQAAKFRDKVRRGWGDNRAGKTACYERFLMADWKTILASQNETQIESLLDSLIDPPAPDDNRK